MRSYSEPTGYKMKPRSRDVIRRYAHRLRQLLSIDSAKVDVIKVIEQLWYEDIISLEIVDDYTLDEHYGETIHLLVNGDPIPHIKLENRVFEGAADDNPRDRFTVAHEIGHAILHKESVTLARSISHRSKNLHFYDSEWQASAFAAEFLADIRHIRRDDEVFDIEGRFGISAQSARILVDTLRRRGEMD